MKRVGSINRFPMKLLQPYISSSKQRNEIFPRNWIQSIIEDPQLRSWFTHKAFPRFEHHSDDLNILFHHITGDVERHEDGSSSGVRMFVIRTGSHVFFDHDVLRYPRKLQRGDIIKFSDYERHGLVNTMRSIVYLVTVDSPKARNVRRRYY